jgi:ATP-binding cassette subfamily D (ALD) long-chain fatty acid import protein
VRRCSSSWTFAARVCISHGSSPRVNRHINDDETAMTVLSTLRQRSHPAFAPAFASFANTYATHRPLIQRILTAGFIAHVLASTFSRLLTRPSPPSSSKGKGKAREQPPSAEAGKPPRVAVRAYSSTSSTCLTPLHQVDAVFYQRLSRILRLVIPSLRSKEALLLAMHSSLLIFRTAISLYVAALDGK